MKKLFFFYALVVLNIPVYVNASTLIPEFYGFYGLDDGELKEITTSWDEMPDLSSKAELIIFQKNISQTVQDMKIIKSMYIRNHIYLDFNSGKITGFKEQKHYYTDIDNEQRTVGWRSKPVKGEKEMIYLVPRKQLEPGIYALIPGSTNIYSKELPKYYFKIDESKVTENGHDCFDMYYNNPFASALGPGALKPCSKFSVPGSENNKNKTVVNSNQIENERKKILQQITDDSSYEEILQAYKNTDLEPLITPVTVGDKPGVINAFFELLNTAKDTNKFNTATKTFPYSVGKVWEAVQSMIANNDEKIELSLEVKELSLGLIVTTVTHHSSLWSPKYDKFYILINEVSDNQTRIAMKLLSYSRDSNKSTKENLVLIPLNRDQVAERTTKFLEDLTGILNNK